MNTLTQTQSLANDYSFLIIFSLIIIVTVAVRILFVNKISYSEVNKPLCLVAIYSVSVCLIICLISAKIGIFKISTTGNPVQTVTQFYDSIIANEYANAYTLLNNCDSLGLEAVSGNNAETSEKLTNALSKSYSYSLSENVVISGLTASQTVNFTYLNISKIEEKISASIEPILNVKIEELPRTELYTEDGHYKKELMDSVYNEALDQALKNVEDYYETITYDVMLEYTSGNWYINTNEDMIKGFLGGK